MSQPSNHPCCLCGDPKDAAWCSICKHYFCGAHRKLWAVWERGQAAVKQHLLHEPPQFCRHHAGREAA